MVSFGPIRKTEAYSEGTLVWEYRSYAMVNNKAAGYLSGYTEDEVQERMDYFNANPDEYISIAMSSGKL